jgi:hypothetical protein
MSFSNYCENFLLNYLFTNKTIYVAYGTAATESSFTEISGNGYTRKAYGSWTLTSVGVDAQEVSNDNNITFPQATGNQGTVTHVAFFDASTGGNLIATVSFAELSLDNINVITGTIVQFDAGDCICTLD